MLKWLAPAAFLLNCVGEPPVPATPVDSGVPDAADSGSAPRTDAGVEPEKGCTTVWESVFSTPEVDWVTEAATNEQKCDFGASGLSCALSGATPGSYAKYQSPPNAKFPSEQFVLKFLAKIDSANPAAVGNVIIAQLKLPNAADNIQLEVRRTTGGGAVALLHNQGPRAVSSKEIPVAWAAPQVFRIAAFPSAKLDNYTYALQVGTEAPVEVTTPRNATATSRFVQFGPFLEVLSPLLPKARVNYQAARIQTCP